MGFAILTFFAILVHRDARARRPRSYGVLVHGGARARALARVVLDHGVLVHRGARAPARVVPNHGARRL